MDYSKMTHDEEVEILTEVVKSEMSVNPQYLFGLPGVYEILSEHHNNEVLDIWANRQD